MKKAQDGSTATEDAVKRVASYFSWRQPYRGDEKRAEEDARWALNQVHRNPEELAVLILETTNERNILQRRMKAMSVITTNADFVEDATVESVEWAFGKKLKKSPKS